MQADPHKLDFRSDLLARLPGAGGLGPLGPMGGALPPTHDLTRPPSLFSATGACVHIFASQEQLKEFVDSAILDILYDKKALSKQSLFFFSCFTFAHITLIS